jgi:hypothetical protein
VSEVLDLLPATSTEETLNICGDDDAHPPGVVCLRKQKGQRERETPRQPSPRLHSARSNGTSTPLRGAKAADKIDWRDPERVPTLARSRSKARIGRRGERVASSLPKMTRSRHLSVLQPLY